MGWKVVGTSCGGVVRIGPAGPGLASPSLLDELLCGFLPHLPPRAEKVFRGLNAKISTTQSGCPINAKLTGHWCLACYLPPEWDLALPVCPLLKSKQTFCIVPSEKPHISPAYHGRRNWLHYWRCRGFQHLPYAVLSPAQKRLRGAQRTTMQNRGDVNFQDWEAWSCQGKPFQVVLWLQRDHSCSILHHEASVFKRTVYSSLGLWMISYFSECSL